MQLRSLTTKHLKMSTFIKAIFTISLFLRVLYLLGSWHCHHQQGGQMTRCCTLPSQAQSHSRSPCPTTTQPWRVACLLGVPYWGQEGVCSRHRSTCRSWTWRPDYWLHWLLFSYAQLGYSTFLQKLKCQNCMLLHVTNLCKNNSYTAYSKWRHITLKWYYNKGRKNNQRACA